MHADRIDAGSAGSPAGRVRRLVRDDWFRIGALGAGAIVIWVAAMTQIHYRDVSDLGLVSVLPAWAYLSFALLAAAFASMLARPGFPAWMAVFLTLALVGILYGASPYLSGEPRLAVSWRHLGVIEYVMRRGSVDASLDVYHNWPGFFVLAAAIVDGLGIPDLRAIATWAPVWWALACLPALHLLFSTLTTDRRVVWLAMWLFITTNWIAQDYFAPQALGFFVFLVLTTLAVRWLARHDLATPPAAPATPAGPGDDGGRLVHALRWWPVVRTVAAGRESRAAALGSRRRAGLMAAFVLAFGFVVSAHQLTPFFVLGAVVVLVVLWRIRWPTLPVLMAVMIGAWVVFFGVPYLTGHLDSVVDAVGAVGQGVSASVLGRLGGSDEHVIVVRARVVFTLCVWALAALGVVRRLRAGRWDISAVALAAAPFPVFALQTYGGEMLLRVTLFSLPFMALLGAFLVFPRIAEGGRGSRLAVAVLVFATTSSLMLVRYGNERLETFSDAEVAAIDHLYRAAPPGSQLMAVAGNVPWKWTGYELYRLWPRSVDDVFGDEAAFVAAAEAHSGPAFLVISRSQRTYVELLLGLEPGAYDTFAADLLATGRFRPVYENEDAIVAEFVPAP